eukprot:g12327.t1
MIDDVLTSCLPVAAMAESTAASAATRLGAESAAAAAAAAAEKAAPANASGTSTPRVHPAGSISSTEGSSAGIDSSNTPATHTNEMDWDPAPNPKQIQLVGPMSSSQTSSFAPAAAFSSGGGGAAGTGMRPGGGLSRRGSGSVFVDKVGISRIPDRAWTIALDYLDLAEIMRCRQLGRVFRDTVEASLSVLALSGVNTLTWATPENLTFLTRFKNVRTLHWYVGVGEPSKEETAAAAAQQLAIAEAEAAAAAADGPAAAAGAMMRAAAAAGAGDAADRFGAAAGERALRIADCCPVRAWAFLLGALPKIEEVIIVEGAGTDEIALEQVWLHLLPLCTNLRSFFLNFEDYSRCPVDGDHPPINVKKFAVFLQAKKPFPKLRELHLELGSMSIAEQRSLIRGLSSSGLLPQLEKVTLGDGTTSYVRNPGRGPGRDLFAAFKKTPCRNLRVLWLQRLDLWDDLESLASALSTVHCPVLEELFLDLALDTDDVARLAACLHKFPTSLKTLGVLTVAIKNRTPEGAFELADPERALQLLADSLSKHPRYHSSRPPFKARTATMPILNLIKSGKLAGVKHVQLSSCGLDDNGLLTACKAVANMKGIQTLDLSSNQLSLTGAAALAKALWRCRSLHEIVLEESVTAKDSEKVSEKFKEFLPWATVRVDDRESRKGPARRSISVAGQDPFFGGDADDQDAFSDEDDGGEEEEEEEMEGGPMGGGMDDHQWEAADAESDGEVPPELMMDDDSSDED